MDELLDQPITQPETDLLGFAEVATSLIKAMKAQPNGNSLTLGLDGPWGSGKSSILNLLKASLKTAPLDKGVGIVVVPFSPWLITNRTALVSAFFAQITQALDEAEKRIPTDWAFFKKKGAKALASAKKQLNSFSRVASIASTAASAFDPSLVAAAAAGSSNALEKLTSDTGKSGKTLEVLKSDLSKLLTKIGAADPTFRILVLIDDLDRLDPDDALEVLRLVKAVGDFPATTYLLAYDRSALSRAIEHGAKIENGDAYLEKIIQFSFKVPPLESFRLRGWLREELDKLFPGAITWPSEHASAVLDTWAGRLLKTPRDVKRLLFAIRAIWPSLKGRADLLDLVWLQIVVQKASDNKRDLYSWIVSYLQGLEAVAIGGTVTGEQQERQDLINILREIGWRDYDHERDKLSFDFHHLDQLLAGVTTSHLGKDDGDWTYQVGNSTLQKFREGMRLSSPWHWRLYFALEEPSHAVTDDEWRALLDGAEKSTTDLATSISQILEFRENFRADAADQIMGRASYLLSIGKLNHPGRWTVAIAEQAKVMANRSKRDAFFGLSNLFKINFRAFSRAVFRSISGVDRETTIREIFDRKASLSSAAALLRDQFAASSKEGYEREEQYYLSDSELDGIIAKQVVLYENITPSELRELANPYDVLYAWKDVTGSEVGPTKLLAEASQSDDSFIETLSSLRYLSSSEQKGVPHIPEDFLKPFFDVKAVKKRLEILADGRGECRERAAELLKLWWISDR